MSHGFKNLDAFGDALPGGLELSESESKTSDELYEVGPNDSFEYPALTMGERGKGQPTPKYKRKKAKDLEPSYVGDEDTDPDELFELSMEDQEREWERKLRKLEEGSERPRKQRKKVQLALEDAKEEESEQPSGSSDVPAGTEKRAAKRLLAIEDRLRVKPTQSKKRLRPTKTPQRQAIEARIRELASMAKSAHSARHGLLQQELAKVKARAKRPKAKAKDPKAKAPKAKEAKAKPPGSMG